jgi:MOSC domain-containing protein YiiM
MPVDGESRMFEGSDASGVVTSVSLDPAHRFSKAVQPSIRVLAGLGVEGDAHMGVTVKHRSRVAKDPNQPNLRQIHLIHEELLDMLRLAGFQVRPGIMGENITTRGIALLDLPRATRLRIGKDAVVEVTGLRNPCNQLNKYQPGLMGAVLDRAEDGTLIRKAGIMGIVIETGEIELGDAIRVEWPSGPFQRLEYV